MTSGSCHIALPGILLSGFISGGYMQSFMQDQQRYDKKEIGNDVDQIKNIVIMYNIYSI